MILERADNDIVIHGKSYTKGEFLPFYVPRQFMPQIPPDHLSRMVAIAAADHRLPPTFECVDPHSLIPHQRVNHRLVACMPPTVKHSLVLASADNYILDGNHRWWGNVADACPYMNIIRLQLPFNDAIKWLFELPWVYEVDVDGKMVAEPDHHTTEVTQNETTV